MQSKLFWQRYPSFQMTGVPYVCPVLLLRLHTRAFSTMTKYFFRGDGIKLSVLLLEIRLINYVPLYLPGRVVFFHLVRINWKLIINFVQIFYNCRIYQYFVCLDICYRYYNHIVNDFYWSTLRRTLFWIHLVIVNN